MNCIATWGSWLLEIVLQYKGLYCDKRARVGCWRNCIAIGGLVGWIVLQYRGVQENKIVLQYTFVYCGLKG